MFKVLGAAAVATAATAGLYYATRPDPILASINKWEHEDAPSENRGTLAHIIRDAYERDIAMLTIHDTSITTLPETLPKNLKLLDLEGCTNLRVLPKMLPDHLMVLNILDCNQLTNLPDETSLCVVIAPSHLKVGNFAESLAANAVTMSALVKTAQEGKIENGAESIELIKKTSCPLSLSELTKKTVVLIANSMNDMTGKCSCTLYDIENIKQIATTTAGLHVNPMTREPIRALDIININKEVKNNNLRYNSESGNFELKENPTFSPELRRSNGDRITNLYPIIKSSVTEKSISRILHKMDRLEKDGSAKSVAQCFVARDYARFVAMNKPL